MTISFERLKEVIQYNQLSGAAIWVKKCGKCIPGMQAGSKHTLGYTVIRIDGERYYLHRLAWFYMHGVWPKSQIDHIDGDTTNNKISNLRESTQAENRQNMRSAMTNSKTGILGVRFRKGKWEARIKVGDRQINLGRFNSAYLAQMAYVDAKQANHPFYVGSA